MSGAGKKAFEGLTRGILAARRKRMDALDAEVKKQRAALDNEAAREGLRIDTYQRGPAVEPRQVFDVPLVSIETLGYNAVEQIQALAPDVEVVRDWQGQLSVTTKDAASIKETQERRDREHLERQDREQAKARAHEAERQAIWKEAYEEAIEQAKEGFRAYRDAAARGEVEGVASYDAVKVVVPEHGPDGGFSDWLEGARLQQVALVSPEQAARARQKAAEALAAFDAKEVKE